MPTPYMKAPERRRQLVAAAREVLIRQGVMGTTLRAVAAEAEVPLGTVSYIFATKELLLRAVLEDVIDEIGSGIRASVGREREFGAMLRGNALRVWENMVEGARGLQVMQYELTLWALRTPGMEDVAHRQYSEYVNILTENWEKAAQRSGVTLAAPAEALARQFLAGVDGLILQYLTLGRPQDTRRDLEALVAQLVRAATDPVT